MKHIEDYCTTLTETEEVKFRVYDHEYKIRISLVQKETDLCIKVYRVGEKDVFCVDFSRKSGDLIQFLNEFSQIKNYLENKLGYSEDELIENKASEEY